MSFEAKHPTSPFTDTNAVAHYAEGPPRIVPGFADMLRMTSLLLAERVPSHGHVLVVGAGGGLELKALAETNANWQFTGVDPAPAMLRLAEQTVGPLAARMRFLEGYIDDAPAGPFDAATCLLTMHFVKLEERRNMAAAMHRRLRPGAPLVVVHLSMPAEEGERAAWLSRYVAFGGNRERDPEQVEKARAAFETHLTILSPEQDEALLREAGFTNVSLFYAGFAFRGWVAYA